MVFLRDGETARAWVAEEPQIRSALVLRDAIEAAGAYFRPLMDD